MSVLVLAIAAVSPSREADADSPLKTPITRSTSALSFQIALDDSVYLPGQPIYLFSSVRNVSDSTIGNFLYMSPPIGLSLDLHRGSRRVENQYLKGTWIVTPEKLQPSEGFCAVEDLFEGFGGNLLVDIPNGLAYHVRGIPPGRYDLVARVNLLNQNPAEWPTSEVTFTVLPTSHVGLLDERALRFLESRRGQRKSRRADNWDQVRRSGLEKSRYVAVLAGTFMPDEGAIRMGDFAAEMSRSGLPPLKAAGLLYRRELQMWADPDAQIAWLHAIGPKFPDSSLQCLFHSWEHVAKWRSDDNARMRRLPSGGR